MFFLLPDILVVGTKGGLETESEREYKERVFSLKLRRARARARTHRTHAERMFREKVNSAAH